MKPKVKFAFSLGLWILAIVLDVVSGFSYDRTLFAMAMTFSFAGDVWLLMYGKHHHVKLYFIAGLAFFATAHIMYTLGFLNRLSDPPQLLIAPGVAHEGWVLYVLLLILPAIAIMSLSVKIDKRLIVGIYIYSAIITYAFLTIWKYSIITSKILPGIGISLFLISDLLIGAREFLGIRNKKIDIGIWTLYVTGQVMLLIG